MPTLLRVLVVGFALVILLMAAAAIIGVTNARSTAASAAGLVSDQLTIARLLDEVEREQSVLNAAFFRLSSGPLSSAPGDADRARMLADLDQTDKSIARMTADAVGTPNENAWARLHRAVLDFSEQARQVLNPSLKQGRPSDDSSRDLFSRHEQVTTEVARLVDLSYAHAVETRERVDRQTETLAKETELLVAGCLLIALVCAVITVRIAARVFRQMETQTSELSRVSFRLLETQEATARRFAHELHDELGGSLTAIKSNLTAIAHSLNGASSDRARIDDCVNLVDQSIANVRELSQLLRPTILDDFGLDAGLRWLTERFAERTSIDVDYKSDFDGRLPDETETHLFRIVQEALTNVARHSGASRVAIHLRAAGDSIRLTLSDNGRGIAQGSARSNGMGLSGMRARARSAGGELELKTDRGGVTVEVWAPIHSEQPKEGSTGQTTEQKV
jgi:signal transduction histidine kinase